MDQQGVCNSIGSFSGGSAAQNRDADLTDALSRRDYDHVLAELMARYRQKVLHLAFSIVRDGALAEDLAQTAFVRAWQALPRFDGRAALSTWLYTIVRNTCLSELRKRGRMVSLEATADPDDDTAAWQPAEPRDDHAEVAARHDIAALLDKLAEPYRRVVVLFYLEERSIEDVAALLGSPAGTVKSLLFRARQQLAALAIGRQAA